MPAEIARFKCGCKVERDALSKRVFSVTACREHSETFDEASKVAGPRSSLEILLAVTRTTMSELETAFEIRGGKAGWKGDTRK